MTLPVRFSDPASLLLLLLLPAVFRLFRRSLGPRRAGVRGRGAILVPGIRAGVLGLLILAASGLQIRGKGAGESVVFLLDRSQSIGQVGSAAGVDFVSRAVAAMGDEDRAGLVVFAGEALVEWPMKRRPAALEIRSVPTPQPTDIAGAIRLATSMLSGEVNRRMVLISDGRQTTGEARREAGVAAARGIRIDALPIGEARAAGEVWMEGLTAPARVRLDEPFELAATVMGNRGSEVGLELRQAGNLVAERQAVLRAEGRNEFRFPYRLDNGGLHSFTVSVESPRDQRLQDNEGGAVVLAAGRPRMLYLTPTPGRDVLAQVLSRHGFELDLASPASFQQTGSDLADFDTVVLNDVPAADLGDQLMIRLGTYVADKGGGLVMVGGTNSFGPGGYAGSPVEQILPVEMRVRRRKEMPGRVLVLILDKSGSMAGDDGGLSKLAAAKEAALSLFEVLDEEDSLGVIAFDREAVSVMSPRRVADPDAVRKLFDRLEAGGGTKLAPALVQAYQWLGSSVAENRYALLLSDGQAEPAELDEIRRLLAGSPVVLSAVGIGADVDRGLLIELARIAGGRVYFPESLEELPEVFRREGRLISGDWVVERSFRPRPAASHEILRGIDAAAIPAVNGYIASTAKVGSSVLLVSDLRDPILACWRFGLGRTLVFTSGLASSWTADWAAWASFGKMWSQAARWTARRLESDRLEARLSIHGDRGRITVDAYAPDGRFLNGLTLQGSIRRPDSTALQIPLVQTDSGRYEADFEFAGRGLYLATVTASGEGLGAEETVMTGLQVPLLAEHRSLGPDLSLLDEITNPTGGSILDARQSPFVGESAAASYRAAWKLPAIAALFLFLLDVALRRRLYS